MIKERHSVRSYFDKPIEGETLELMQQKIDEINAGSGLHIQYIPDSKGAFSSLMFKIVGWKWTPGYLAIVGKDGDDEKCGYCGEKLVLYLQSIGLNTCWVGMFRRGAIPATTEKDEKVIITIVVGYGTDQGHPHKSRPVSEITNVTEMPDWFSSGLECAMLAPTAVNQQKFSIGLDGDKAVVSNTGKKRFTEVDLGIVKCHFEIGAGAEHIEINY